MQAAISHRSEPVSVAPADAATQNRAPVCEDNIKKAWKTFRLSSKAGLVGHKDDVLHRMRTSPLKVAENDAPEFDDPVTLLRFDIYTRRSIEYHSRTKSPL